MRETGTLSGMRDAECGMRNAGYGRQRESPSQSLSQDRNQSHGGFSFASFPIRRPVRSAPCKVRRGTRRRRGGSLSGQRKKRKAKLETPGHYGKYFSTNNYTGRPEHQATRRQPDPKMSTMAHGGIRRGEGDRCESLSARPDEESEGRCPLQAIKTLRIRLVQRTPPQRQAWLVTSVRDRCLKRNHLCAAPAEFIHRLGTEY